MSETNIREKIREIQKEMHLYENDPEAEGIILSLKAQIRNVRKGCAHEWDEVSRDYLDHAAMKRREISKTCKVCGAHVVRDFSVEEPTEDMIMR